MISPVYRWLNKELVKINILSLLKAIIKPWFNLTIILAKIFFLHLLLFLNKILTKKMRIIKYYDNL